MKQRRLLILFCFITLSVVAQRPDSVQVNGQWYFVYPLQEKLKPSSGLLDKLDLSETQFELFRDWKLANDPRLKLSKRTLIDSLNRELIRTKITVSEEQNKYEWRDATRPEKMIRPFLMRKKYWYRNNPELVTDREIDLNHDLVPAVQNLPNGRYIQYFEPMLSYHEMKNTTVLPTRVAAMFELKNNLLENEFTRFNYKGDTIRHGYFADGLKEKQWTISNSGNYLRSGIHGLRKKNTLHGYSSSIQVELQKGILNGHYIRKDGNTIEESGYFKNGYPDSIWVSEYWNWGFKKDVIDVNSIVDSNYLQPLLVEIAPADYFQKKYDGFDFKEENLEDYGVSFYQLQDVTYEREGKVFPLTDFSQLFNYPMRVGVTKLKQVTPDSELIMEPIKTVNFHGSKQVFSRDKLKERYTYLPELGAIVFTRFFKNGAVFDTLGFNSNDSTFVYNIYDANGKLFQTKFYTLSGKMKDKIDYFEKKKQDKVREEKLFIIEGYVASREGYYSSKRYSKYAVWYGSQIIDGKRYEKIVWDVKTKERTFETYTNIADSSEHSIYYNQKGKPALAEILFKTDVDSIWGEPVYDTLYSVMYGDLNWEQKLANNTKEPAILKCFDVPYSGPLNIRFSGDKLQLDDQAGDGLKWTIPMDLYSKTLEKEFSDVSFATEYSFRFSKRKTSQSTGWDYGNNFGNPFTNMMLEIFRGQIGFYAIARMEGEFQNGQPAGNWNYYDKKGNVIFTLNFVNGLPNGDVSAYLEYSGPHRFDRKYHKDEPYYDFLFSKDAPKTYLEQTYHFVNGKLNGPSVTYTALGDTLQLKDYKMGEFHGKVWKRLNDNVSVEEYQNGKLHGLSLEGNLEYNDQKEVVMDTLRYAYYEDGLLNGDGYFEFYENDDDDENYGNGERLRSSRYGYNQVQKNVRCRFQKGLLHGNYVQRKESGETECTLSLSNGMIDTLTFFENDAPSYYYDYAEEERLLPYQLSDTAALNLQTRFFYHPQLSFLYYNVSEDDQMRYGRIGEPYSRSRNIEDYKQGRFTKLYPNGNIARRGYRIGDKSWGDWDFYNYNGQRLYSIDYGIQTVVMHGVTYSEAEIKGEYVEYDSLGGVICRGSMIEELEKYDCAHSDYYAIRQFIIIEDREDTYERTNGPMKYYFDNGMLMSEGTLKNGMPDGVWKFYTPDGKLTRIGKYVNGKKEGRWLKGDLGDKKYIGEICLNPDDPLLDFHIAELERMRDVEIVVYKNGVAQIQQQYEVTD